ncbi:two-peptide bacteriocin subunit PneA1, partial [Streptococcus pneumoniae]
MTNFNSNEKFCGKSLKSLSADEMSLIYGASDGAEPRWTPTPIILKSAAASSKV